MPTQAGYESFLFSIFNAPPYAMERKRHFFNTDSDDTKRRELITRIERAVEKMSTSELEALSYDMFTKGYIDDLG